MKTNSRFTFAFLSKWIAIILLPVILFIGTYIPEIKFNYDIDSFYDPSDPQLKTYNQFKEHFENENDYILIGIRNKKGIFHQEFLVKVDSLTHLLEKKSWVSKIISPTSLYETSVSFGMPLKIPMLHIDDSSKLISDKEKIYSGSIYNGLIFSEDEQSVSLIVRINKDSFPGNEQVVSDLNKEISVFNFTEFHLAGRPITQFYYKAQMQKEMKMFVLISVILVFLTVIFLFKSLLISLSVLISLAGSLIVVYGMIGWFQFEITLIQTMLPLILLITGVSPCIHLISHYRMQNHGDRVLALKKAFAFTFTPNTLNTITTSLGFATLWFLPMPPIREFAIVTCAGVLVTYFVSIGLLTGILRIIPIQQATVNKPGTGILKIYRFYSQRRIWVYAISVFIFLLSAYSVSRTEVKNNFLDDVPEGSELKSSLYFFEERFSGIRPLEIFLVPKQKK